MIIPVSSYCIVYIVVVFVAIWTHESEIKENITLDIHIHVIIMSTDAEYMYSNSIQL